MFLSLFTLEPTGNYQQVELPDHALCALCLDRKAQFIGLYQYPGFSIYRARKLCWVCLNKDFLKPSKPMRTGFSSGLIGPPDGGAA